jgi:hypothetical protein
VRDVEVDAAAAAGREKMMTFTRGITISFVISS